MGAGILRAIGDSKRPLYFPDCQLLYQYYPGHRLRRLPAHGCYGSRAGYHHLPVGQRRAGDHRADEDEGIVPPDSQSIRLDLDMLKRIIQIGFPAGLQSVMYSASNVIIQSSVNALGTDTIAAWTAYGKIDSVFWMIINAFGISVTTFVGQNYGAGKRTGFIREYTCVWP